MKGYAALVQNILGQIAAQGERLTALLEWRDPRASTAFCSFCAIAAVFLFFAPIRCAHNAALWCFWTLTSVKGPRIRPRFRGLGVKVLFHMLLDLFGRLGFRVFHGKENRVWGPKDSLPLLRVGHLRARRCSLGAFRSWDHGVWADHVLSRNASRPFRRIGPRIFGGQRVCIGYFAGSDPCKFLHTQCMLLSSHPPSSARNQQTSRFAEPFTFPRSCNLTPCLLTGLAFWFLRYVAILVGCFIMRHPRFRNPLPPAPVNLFLRLPSLEDRII